MNCILRRVYLFAINLRFKSVQLGEVANVGGIFTSWFLHPSRITGIFCDKLIHNTTDLTYFQDVISFLPSLTRYYYFTLGFFFILHHSLIKAETLVLQLCYFFVTVKVTYIFIHMYIISAKIIFIILDKRLCL